MNEPLIRKSGIVDVKFGKNVTIVEPVNLYGCTIGDNVFIGPFVEIQKNVTIQSGCRIHSHVFICEYVTIGHGCFISHGAMFVNDLVSDGKPVSNDKTKLGRTTIGNQVVIGTNSVVLPVNICDRAVIGAGSVVTGNIQWPGVYAGNPARLLRVLSDDISSL